MGRIKYVVRFVGLELWGDVRVGDRICGSYWVVDIF